MHKSFLILLAGCVIPSLTLADCETQCSAQYPTDTDGNALLLDLCVNACANQPELFDVEFPYLFGPLKIQPYAEFTGVDPNEIADLTGVLWARVDVSRTRMQFYYSMDDNPEPYFPYAA